jgi:hypothetical protein
MSLQQRLFFAVAYSYCDANNIDLSPECDAGSGQVDFKFSKGFDARVVVEIKLSTNPKVIAGYSMQLQTYMKAEETDRGVYPNCLVALRLATLKKKQLRTPKRLWSSGSSRVLDFLRLTNARQRREMQKPGAAPQVVSYLIWLALKARNMSPLQGFRLYSS